jgi:pyridoxamine 5'-phosphate oxidase
MRPQGMSSLFDQLSPNPFQQFDAWYSEAETAKISHPYTAYLATASLDGEPSVRTVFWRGQNAKGYLFFTNYRSQKSVEMISNPHASLLFHWPQLERQIRITGLVEKATESESDEYWNTRPRESQLNSAASPQSSALQSREQLEKLVADLDSQYKGQPVPRPSNWGGFCLIPKQFEFWQAHPYRLHDRVRYAASGSASKGWLKELLAP